MSDDSRAIYRGSNNPTSSTGFSDTFYWKAINASLEADGTNTYKAIYQLEVYANPNAGDPITLKSLKLADRDALTIKVRFNPSKDGSDFNQNASGGVTEENSRAPVS